MCNSVNPLIGTIYYNELHAENFVDNAPWPGILIGYNEDAEKFSVASANTQCGYFVPRGDVVGDYRNFGEVVAEIMSGCERPVMLLIDEAARKEIDLIWEANIVLF